MRYALLVLTPPDAGHSPAHALGFARALLEAGHELLCVFFYDAGVLTAGAGPEPPQDEQDLRNGWQTVNAEYATPLFACTASAARFGVGSETGAPMLDGFSIAGLGELIDAQHRADRFLTFAG